MRAFNAALEGPLLHPVLAGLRSLAPLDSRGRLSLLGTRHNSATRRWIIKK